MRGGWRHNKRFIRLCFGHFVFIERGRGHAPATGGCPQHKQLCWKCSKIKCLRSKKIKEWAGEEARGRVSCVVGEASGAASGCLVMLSCVESCSNSCCRPCSDPCRRSQWASSFWGRGSNGLKSAANTLSDVDCWHPGRGCARVRGTPRPH